MGGSRSMPPAGYLCHYLPGRIRYQIPEKRRDAAYFSRLQEQLNGLDGIDGVRVNPWAASLVITHRSSVDDVTALIRSHELFEPSDAAPPGEPLVQQASEDMKSLDRRLREWSGGLVDTSSVFLLLLVALAVRQLLKGNILAPATTLLWYALSLILFSRERR